MHLLERAFILDWKSPAGFNSILVPRYINWRSDALFGDELDPIPHVHDIGSINWFQAENKSIRFYTETDFTSYFIEEREAIQSHSFDFTYALTRNRHFAKKLREMGLDRVKCRVCCIWNYLFKHSTSFQHNSASVVRKKLGLGTAAATTGSKRSDLIFVDLSFPLENIPHGLLTRQVEATLDCVRKVKRMLHEPLCVVASNNYLILDKVGKMDTTVRTNRGLFFTRERYQLELSRQLNTTRQGHSRVSSSSLQIPRTEHNALMYFFMGYYLQMNSTVLITAAAAGRRSPYSESMAAYRHFHHPTDTYVVRSPASCKLERYAL